MKQIEYSGWTVGTDADGNGIILHTENGGETWKPQKSNVSGFVPQKVCFIDRLHGWTVGADANNYGTILYTDKGGENWAKQDIPQLPGGFTGISAVDEKTAWVVGNNGVILHMKDGKWKEQKSSQIPPVNLQGVHAIDANIAWATGHAYKGYGTILRTTNGGEPWERVGHKSQEEGDGGIPDVAILGVSAFDSHIAWVVGSENCYILCTGDGGHNWKDLMHGYGSRDANMVTILKEKEIFRFFGWVVEDHGVIYYTPDGLSWFTQDNPGHGNFLLDVSAVDKKNAWVVGASESGAKGGGVILCTKDGIHWEKQYYEKDDELVKVALTGVSFV